MLHGAGIFTNIYPKTSPSFVGKYTIHGAYGISQLGPSPGDEKIGDAQTTKRFVPT